MIRKMKKSDLSKVMDIWLDTNCKTHDFIPRSYWERNFEYVETMISEAEVYVYVTSEDEEVQAFIGLSGNDVGGIFVDSTVQSRGVGKALLDCVKSKKQSLRLSVYEKNKRAIHFYERERFRAVSEGIDENTGEKEIVMVWEALDGMKNKRK